METALVPMLIILASQETMQQVTPPIEFNEGEQYPLKDSMGTVIGFVTCNSEDDNGVAKVINSVNLMQYEQDIETLKSLTNQIEVSAGVQQVSIDDIQQEMTLIDFTLQIKAQ
jgi:hypothetical protein